MRQYFAFFSRLAYKPCIELEVLANEPIGCLSDGPTFIFSEKKVNTKSCSGFFLISIQRLQDSHLDQYFAFCLRLAYKPCIELEVLANEPIGCLSDGPTFIFIAKSQYKKL